MATQKMFLKVSTPNIIKTETRTVTIEKMTQTVENNTVIET
jgi:hypothetical protein